MKKPGKENVLKAIKVLEEKDYVYKAFPNYIYKVEIFSTDENTQQIVQEDVIETNGGSDIQCRFYSGTTYVKGDDNSGGGTKFKITVSMVEGQTYYLAVDNVVQNTGTRGYYTVVCEPK